MSEALSLLPRNAEALAQTLNEGALLRVAIQVEAFQDQNEEAAFMGLPVIDRARAVAHFLQCRDQNINPQQARAMLGGFIPGQQPQGQQMTNYQQPPMGQQNFQQGGPPMGQQGGPPMGQQTGMQMGGMQGGPPMGQQGGFQGGPPMGQQGGQPNFGTPNVPQDDASASVGQPYNPTQTHQPQGGQMPPEPSMQGGPPMGQQQFGPQGGPPMGQAGSFNPQFNNMGGQGGPPMGQQGGMQGGPPMGQQGGFHQQGGFQPQAPQQAPQQSGNIQISPEMREVLVALRAFTNATTDFNVSMQQSQLRQAQMTDLSNRLLILLACKLFGCNQGDLHQLLNQVSPEEASKYLQASQTQGKA